MAVKICRSREPLASLIPTIFLILERLITVSGSILTPVLLGTLYKIIGISTCSAIVCKVMFFETNPIPAKKAAYMMGLAENEIRLPLVESSMSSVITGPPLPHPAVSYKF